VEVLTEDPPWRLPAVSEFDGFVVRRFASSMGHAHLGVGIGMWEHLHRTARSFDLVHVHGQHAALPLAAAGAHPRRLVFTLHAPVRRLLRWPHAHLTRRLIDQGAQIICTAGVQGALLRRRFPWASDRIQVVPHGVDVLAIRAAQPSAFPGVVVLTVGRLERYKRVDRAIAAITGLDHEFRLAVVGEGPARARLLAYADDLRVSSRVEFVGAIPDADLYRWLRSARVFVALTEQESSGLEVAEAISAGLPIVASDIPLHHEVASFVDGESVRFVPPTGSPLDVADAISEAAELGTHSNRPLPLPSWDDVVDRTLAIYTGTARERRMAAGAPRPA
jgi:glycosyltransferase involved in cell wall biosynthesis